MTLRECEKVGEEWKAREEVNQWKEDTEREGKGGGIQEKEESRSHRLLVRSGGRNHWHWPSSNPHLLRCCTWRSVSVRRWCSMGTNALHVYAHCSYVRRQTNDASQRTHVLCSHLHQVVPAAEAQTPRTNVPLPCKNRSKSGHDGHSSMRKSLKICVTKLIYNIAHCIN